jgi:hypothetical protein
MKPMIKPSHKGLLHKSLGVAQGEKISHTQLVYAAGHSNEAVRKRAQFALNAEKWHHAK